MTKGFVFIAIVMSYITAHGANTQRKPTQVASPPPKRVASLKSAATKESSEFADLLWQPDAGDHAVLPLISYAINKFRGTYSSTGSYAGGSYTSETKSESDSTTPALGISYFYGFTDFFAMGASWGWGDSKGKNKNSNTATYTPTSGSPTTLSTSSEPDFENVGMGDPSVFAHFRHRLTPMALHYGLDILLSLGKSEYDSVAKKGNNYSGGMKFIPYLATVFGETFMFGPILSYDINGERKSHYTGSTASSTYDITNTGANILKIRAFGELTQLSFKPSLTLGYFITEKGKSKYSYATGTEYEYESDGATSINAVLRARFEVNDSFSLIPTFEYTQTTPKYSNVSGSYSVKLDYYTLMLTARIVL